MKRKLTRLAAAALSVTLVLGLMTGCGNSGGKGEKTDNGNKTLFTYDGEKVLLKKAWIYAKMSAAQYEATYSSYFGDNFWTMDMGTDAEGNAQTLESYAKEQVVTQIKKIIVLNKHADEAKVSLSDKEKEDCAGYAKAFAEDPTGKAILAECGGTEKDMTEIYEENAVASKVQEYMTKDTDTQVSDEEARKTTISRVVFPVTKTDEQGNTIDMNEKEKADVLAKAQAALAKLQAGTSIADIVKEQNYTNTKETFAAGESEEGKKFEKLLAGMKDGDSTNAVQECDNGYVIASLEAYTDAEATASNKETIIAERQQTKFTEVYDTWTKDLEKDWSYQKDVDQALWAELILHKEESTATESGAETTTAAPETGTTAAPEGNTDAAPEAGTTEAR